MNVPHYFNEIISDVRRIEPGCYAMDDHGNVSSGPFASREDCVSRISRANERNDIV